MLACASNGRVLGIVVSAWELRTGPVLGSSRGWEIPACDAGSHFFSDAEQERDLVRAIEAGSFVSLSLSSPLSFPFPSFARRCDDNANDRGARVPRSCFLTFLRPSPSPPPNATEKFEEKFRHCEKQWPPVSSHYELPVSASTCGTDPLRSNFPASPFPLYGSFVFRGPSSSLLSFRPARSPLRYVLEARARLQFKYQDINYERRGMLNCVIPLLRMRRSSQFYPRE